LAESTFFGRCGESSNSVERFIANWVSLLLAGITDEGRIMMEEKEKEERKGRNKERSKEGHKGGGHHKVGDYARIPPDILHAAALAADSCPAGKPPIGPVSPTWDAGT
jgi:hypothetical protein